MTRLCLPQMHETHSACVRADNPGTMRDLPSGTVTFLFTDIEGSTRLLHELGGAYAEVLVEHRRLLREAFSRHGGVEVDTQGDAFFVAFARAGDALAAAREAQSALAAGPVRVRIGIHTGEPQVEAEGYVGIDVHRAARICAAGHGGQVLVSEVTEKLTGSDDFRDLGVVRLKDLSAPQRLYQLGATDFAPLRCLRDTNLPVVASAFVGRANELAELAESVCQRRIVTLIGAGGSGKSRLALQTAAEAADQFEDGVWWVPLAAVRNPVLVSGAIASAVGSGPDLAGFLAERSMLIVLDNMEHVLDSVSDIAALLSAAPAVHLVATSREPLRLEGEHRYPLAPMSAADARGLFLDRAQAIDPDITPDAHLVDEICLRLDHLPLAIELAAARTSLLSPQALLDRLDESLQLLTGGPRDRPERQRTLRATIDWSHDLLTPEEQHTFRRLSVFVGGCRLEAAEEVCQSTLEVFGSLVEKSMVRRWADGRLGMLEIVREYARERLARSGEELDTAERHMQHYLARAEDVRGVARWADRDTVAGFRTELGSLRSAVGYALEHQPVAALRLGSALASFWLSADLYADARMWLESAPLEDETLPPESRVRALAGAAMLAFFAAGDTDLADRLATQGLAIATELKDPVHEVELLATKSACVGTRGDHGEAARLLTKALAIARQIGHPRLERLMLHRLGEIERDQGEFTLARKHLHESLQMSRALGDGVAGATTHSLGDLELDAGNFTEAMRRYVESFSQDIAPMTRRDETYGVAGIAAAAAGLGSAATALRLWASVEQEERAIGFRMIEIERRRYEHWARQAASILTEDQAVQLRTQAAGRTWDETVTQALHIAGTVRHGLT
jgi:predicted ATPase/class 3 adenylate cyclase